MRINWVFADGYQLDPTVDVEKIKSVGSTWGSWRTWRSCSTDNVICHDLDKAQNLISRQFQNACNFHIPKKYYEQIGSPRNVKLYEGNFPQVPKHAEDIVAMHFVATISDIVLMVGFDLTKPLTTSDQIYHGLVRGAFTANSKVQWVLVDHSQNLNSAYQNLPNLTCDTMKNVLQLLI